MIDILLKWAIPFVCGGVITALATYIKMRKKKDSAVELGVQCLLRAEIVRSHEKYTTQGYCPTHIKEALTREYTAYSALGGNDVASELYHQLLELPSHSMESNDDSNKN